jgi:hypothetical protein
VCLIFWWANIKHTRGLSTKEIISFAADSHFWLCVKRTNAKKVLSGTFLLSGSTSLHFLRSILIQTSCRHGRTFTYHISFLYTMNGINLFINDDKLKVTKINFNCVRRNSLNYPALNSYPFIPTVIPCYGINTFKVWISYL